MKRKRWKTSKTLEYMAKIRENRDKVIERLNNTENLEEYNELIYFYHKYNELEEESKRTLKMGLRLSV